MDLRVRWAPYATGTYGGFLGYSNLIKVLKGIVTDDRSSDIALHCTNPDWFTPDPGAKRNVLITMWESPDFPKRYIPKLRQADAVIVPSRFCKSFFSKVCDCPVFYMPLAVDEAFTWVRRERPKVFRWLWVNAPDARKGYHLLARIWDENFISNPNVELYLKTTNNTGDRVEKIGNVIFDSRVLPKRDLVALYQGAHGYLYPSMGEGFGFTLAEAMATGLPAVAPNYSGYTDFYSAVTGFPCAHQMVTVARKAHIDGDEMDESVSEDGDYRFARADPTSLVIEMMRIMRKYEAAVEIGKKGSKTIKSKFTRETMANGLAHALASIR